ncbi:MAG: AMP-binding protein [Pseudomonadota bacterium]
MNSTLFSKFSATDEAIALFGDTERISYGELDAHVNRFAAALLGLGLKPGDLFAFLLPNCAEVLYTYMACARTGIVGLPLSQRISGAELAFQVKDSGAKALLYARDFAKLVAERREALSHLPHLLDEDFIHEVSLSDAPAPDVRPNATDPFCVMYTGGTTGKSKAAVQSHQSWMCALETSVEQWGLSASDRHLIVLPMSHAAWYTAGATLLAGGSVTIVKHWDPHLVLQLVERHRITTLNMIPTMLNDLISAFEAQPRDVSSIRLLTVAGSVLPIATYERSRAIFGEAIGNVYGLTELAGPVTFLLPSHMAEGKFRSVGKIGKHIEMALLDDDGKPSPSHRGELGLAGPQVTLGYLNNPDETRNAFAGRWFKTGDVVEVDGEGFLYVVDRKKDMIKTGGFNVYPSEVEQVLYRHPAVLEAAVIGVPDEKWSEALHAVVVVRADAGCTAQDIMSFCRTGLAGHKVPKEIHFVQKLPRTHFGKFDKPRILKDLMPGLGS